jgi:hypothetical protein
MRNREWKRYFTILNSTFESPLVLVAELLDISQFLLILFFVSHAEFLNNFKACLLDAIILIKQSRDHVREKSTFVVTLIRKSHQEVSDCLVEAFSNLSAAVHHKHRKVVHSCSRIVKLFDWNDVRISETYHVLKYLN